VRQEDLKFEDSLGYKARLHLQTNKQKKPSPTTKTYILKKKVPKIVVN
jgi:hypothetical protein